MGFEPVIPAVWILYQIPRVMKCCFHGTVTDYSSFVIPKGLVTKGEWYGNSDVVSKTVPVGNRGFLISHVPCLTKVSLGQVGDVDNCVGKVGIVMCRTDWQKSMGTVVSQDVE